MTRPLLFHGGRIHVGAGRSADALLARDGRVAGLGTARDLRREAPAAETIDLDGGLMTPGFIDAHVHFIWWSLQMTQLDLSDEATLDDALGRVRAYARTLPEGAWILGGRFDKNVWGRWPTAAELDRASDGRPAALRSRDGHSRWVNTAALARAAITAAARPPDGGTILRDAGGQPTGVLQENANALIDAIVPPPTDEEMLAAALRGQQEAWKRGIVGFENLDAFRDRFPLTAFERLHAEGKLGMRAHIGLPRASLDEAIARGLRTGAGDEWLRIGHVKIFTDGALGSQTAALEEPYLGSDDRGILTIEPAALKVEVTRAAASGLAVAIHAIGDRAVKVALDAIAPTRLTAPALRPKVEHVQLVRHEDLDRFAQLGVIASMQPIHATSDRDLADRYWG
ncbi:MAG: amidohydrolase, partial [Chloroflexota bacterium]